MRDHGPLGDQLHRRRSILPGEVGDEPGGDGEEERRVCVTQLLGDPFRVHTRSQHQRGKRVPVFRKNTRQPQAATCSSEYS